ncbi:MAG: hypothetical protein IT443_08515 [Phycisphaeraceae bacterium]|nr:hypothetical protein [Phycisphaeraceae bacterium]
MSKRLIWTRIAKLAGTMVVVGVIAGPAMAQQAPAKAAPAPVVKAAPAPVAEPAPGPNSGAVKIDLSLDYVSQYYLRGMMLQDEGLILQPNAKLTFALYESDGMIQSLDWYVGLWNSFHSDQSDYAATTSEAWFEADPYTGVKFGLPSNFGADVSYVVRSFPNGWRDTIQEIDLAINYNDADLMSGFGLPALNPYVLFAFELRDEAGSEDIYNEVGIAPAVTLMESETYPVTLSFPVKLGLSLDGYYGNGSDFGYLSFGPDLSVPLSFIPAEFGAWRAHAGVTMIWADEMAQDNSLTGSQDDLEVYGTVGVSMSY